MGRLGLVLMSLALGLSGAVGASAADGAGGAGWGDAVATKHVTSRLVAATPAAAPGKTLTVALDQTVIPGWHTYWKNPGDTGLPTRIKWTLPEGWTAGAIQWPTPAIFKTGDLVNYGYEDEVRLLTDLTPPADAKVGDTATVTAEAQWLVCSDICIPERAKLTLPIKVEAAPGAADAQAAGLFRAARAAMPSGGLRNAAFVTGDGAGRIEVPLPQGVNARSAYFFPEDSKVVAPQAAQTAQFDGGVVRLSLPSAGPRPPGPVRGILVLASADAGAPGAGRRAYSVALTPGAAPAAAATPTAEAPAETAAPIAETTAPDAAAALAGPEPVAATAVAADAGTEAQASAAPAPPAPAAFAGLWQAALFALLGGMILNLMPCVFPILSMKALALARHGAEEARAHGLAYAAGVMACFAAVALLLIGLRAGGAQIGWGFQLQSPWVVLVLAEVMFLLGLSMSGLFAFGGGFASVGSGLAGRKGLSGSFFTGVLATLVATPCTAPFMGAAVGYALVQPWYVALVVFLALGLGMALPFVLLASCRPLLRLMPKPGPWMERLKQLLAFPLYASAVWLVWVLAIQTGPGGAAAALAGMVVLAFAAWAGSTGLSRTWRWAGYAAAGVAGAVVLASLGGAIAAGPTAAAPTEEAGEAAFTQARLDSLRESGRPVLVNMTAAWCITCLANERTSLSRGSVQDAMARKHVAYLKGDWTSEDPEITAVLQRFGRDGVPLYLLYHPGRDEPQILPQLLTEKLVLDALAPLPEA